MVKRISTQEVQAHLLDVLGAVHDTKEAVIVERDGQPLAVVMSAEEYETLREQRAWATVARVRERNADKSEDEVIADVNAEVEAVRQELHERDRQ